ncbi:alpha/beta hydrolase family protein [Massilia sp. GCM10023247]|uniref:hydrolase 1, exosortase A system-associated n=1 Tax=Massilia sp. GCM10023247 TaxID=3252643 RepID=UPI0036243A10
MKLEQRALRFHAAGVGLIGIVDVPERPLVRGMLVLPDSTQYRAGSHRRFTLLSRLLAGRGIAVMRFDRRGFGDSEGDRASPGSMPAAEDIEAALKEFFIHVPEMTECVILAPGDAAPLAASYAAGDSRVTGLALLDPLLPSLAAGGLPQPAPLSVAQRLLRRAAALGRAAAEAAGAAAAPGTGPAAAPAPAGFGGSVLLICAGSAAGSSCALEHQGAPSRRIELAGCGEAGGSAWREAVAFACASWLTSW